MVCGGRSRFDVLRLGLGLHRRGLLDSAIAVANGRLLRFLFRRLGNGDTAADAAPDFFGHVVVDGAGVRFLFTHAESGQHLEDLV